MSKVKSKRNKNVIPVDGFMYIFYKLSADETKRFWRCRKDLSCPAQIHTGIYDFKVLKCSDKKHCHDSDELPDEILPLFEWFEEFYIGKKNRRI